MHKYARAHTHTHTHTYAHTYIHIHTHIHTYTQIHISTHTHTHTHNKYTFTYTRIYIYTYTHLQIHIYIIPTPPRRAMREGGDPLTNELPDGTVLRVPWKHRITCPEVLFRPSLLAERKGVPGLGAIASKSIQFCDKDLRKVLYGSVVIAGGTSLIAGKRLGVCGYACVRVRACVCVCACYGLGKTLLPSYRRGHTYRYALTTTDTSAYTSTGTYTARARTNTPTHAYTCSSPARSGFGDRLQQEIQQSTGGKQAVTVHADSQRKCAAWIGGSMIASLSTFHHMKISKQEYDDSHAATVHRKCF